MRYFGPLIVVEEIARARKFYEELLEQSVEIGETMEAVAMCFYRGGG